MEIIKAKKYENETATVEIHGQIHEIKNPKNGQELEFYGKKYQLQIEEPKNQGAENGTTDQKSNSNQN